MKNNLLSLSEEQEKAVDITKNITVSAGAGSGKTRVLTNRYLKLIESGIAMEKIVAITFTEKAALEMKARIREVLLFKIEEADKEEKNRWQRELDKLSSASISTIHSFCAKLIRENAAFVGIDFQFEIINDIDKRMLLQEIAKKAMEEIICSGSYDSLVEIIKEVYGENYFQFEFIDCLLNIRNTMLNKNEDFESILKTYGDNDINKFIISMVVEIDRNYYEKKLEVDVLDYNDLESLCCKLLKDTRIRERYKKRYERFLVDEFQDTNEIQKSIIYSLVTEKNKIVPKKLFIVGDFKQSIYGFRGTDYTIFKEVAEEIGRKNQVSLSTCYRSKPGVINGINNIFTHLIKDYECLKCPVASEDSEKRIIYITYDKKAKEKMTYFDKVKASIKEKKYTLEEFKENLQGLKESYDQVSITEDKNLSVMKAIKLLNDKGLEFKDICILVRSKFLITGIEEQLKKRNIPYCIIGGKGFYGKEEVENLLLLYEIVVNGFEDKHSIEEDVKVISILRSCIFNIPDDILFRIKVEKTETTSLKNYIEAAEVFAEGLNDCEDKKLLEKTITTLLKLSEISSRLTVTSLLKAIVEITDLKSILLSQEAGIQKYRNIEKLLIESKKFDDKEMFSSDGFIEYIKILNENTMEDSEASLDTEDSEAIKIMTIHQAKGLEFRGVIVPAMDADCLGMSKKEKNKPDFVYENDKIISRLNLEEDTTNDYKTFEEKKFIKEVEESIRVLYVAMTRAKDFVVLVGEELKESYTKIEEEKDKIEGLNSYSKQIGQVVKMKEEGLNYIEFIPIDELSDMEKIVFEKTETKSVEYENIEKAFNLTLNLKSQNTVSASTYMKYCECERKFYVKNILNIDPLESVERSPIVIEFPLQEDALNLEISKKQLEVNDNSEIYKMGISASMLGSLVHKILEHLDANTDLEDKAIIAGAIKEVIGEELIEKLGQKIEDYLVPVVNKYVENYKKIITNVENIGELILEEKEAYYLVAPMEDRKLMIMGYIDKLQVFYKEGKYIGVITDYKTNRIKDSTSIEHLKQIYVKQLNLYGKAIKDLLKINGKSMDSIKLRLFFLDLGECIELVYEDKKIEKQLEVMDKSFTKDFSSLNIEDFAKKNKESCSTCSYLEFCK